MKLEAFTERLCAISPYLYMQFMEPLGTADSSVDAGWDAVRDIWRPELSEITRSLAPGMIRWGGCFASYYHWKEAVGPFAQRKSMLNLSWDGVYANLVGTREVVEFCRAVGAEPLLVVNMESDGRMHWAYPKPGEDRYGDADEAAEWVDYCNNPDSALRIAHGHKAPYQVKWWQIGNETSYDRRGYKVDKAASVTKQFAEKMKKVDPSIHLIAWGDDGWTPKMLDEAGDLVDYVAFHHHFDSGLPNSPLYGIEYRKDADQTWAHLMHAYQSLDVHIQKVRAEAAPYGKRLVMTEGHFALPGRNRCEVLSSWMAGAAYARCVNVIARNTDILDIATMADFCGNRWQVNAVMLPTPMRAQKPYLQPVGQVMRLFGRHTGKYAARVNAPEGVDATASVSDDKLYLHLVNTNLHKSVSMDLTVDGLAPQRACEVWEIAPDNPADEITELTPNLFDPVQKTIQNGIYRLPPAAVAVLEIDLASLS